MPVFFDYTCSECGEAFEAMTRNGNELPTKCKKCGSETATFKKHLVGPAWIEGTTHGSKPPPLKKACNTPADMFR